MHIEKYKRTAVGHLLEHYGREATNCSNTDIDRSRTVQYRTITYVKESFHTSTIMQKDYPR